MSERDEDEEYSESEYSDDKARCFLLRLYLDRRWRTCSNCCNGHGDMPKNVQTISRSFDHFEFCRAMLRGVQIHSVKKIMFLQNSRH